MDYLMGYPTTKHQDDAILVLVDIFSKMVILIPCKKTTREKQIAQLFFEHVWKHYGLPTTIISDRDARFVSTLWKTPLETAQHETFFVDNLPYENK